MANKRLIHLIAFNAARAVLTSGAIALGFYLLWRYEYLSQFFAIDNFVGLLPVVLVIIGIATLAIAVWVKHSKRSLVPCVCLAVVAVLCFSLFPNALIGNWWVNYGQPQTTENEPSLDDYAPFKAANELATVEVNPDDVLTSNLPQLDGAVALYPVYAAAAQNFYDESAFLSEGGCATSTYTNSGERVIMTNTLRAYNGLINGKRDIIFVAGASENQRKLAKDNGAELVFTPIGKEAFVFITAKSNPVENLTYTQIKNVYSGKTSNWKTLGWKEGGRILDFRRPDGSGSQTALQNLMKDVPLTVPQPLPDRSLIGSNSLMTQMTVEYKGVQPALGYSYKYFATKMYSNPNTKLMKIDGIAPTAENIPNGSYPFTVNFYAVTNGQPSGNVKKLIDLLLSDAGQELIEKTGYARI